MQGLDLGHGGEAHRPRAVVVAGRHVGIFHEFAVVLNDRVIDIQRANIGGVIRQPAVLHLAPVHGDLAAGARAAQRKLMQWRDGQGVDIGVALSAVVIGVIVGCQR